MITVELTELQTKALLYALEDAGSIYEVDTGEGTFSPDQMREFNGAFAAVAKAAHAAGVNSMENPPEWTVS